MATLVLGTIGRALGGPIGGLVGTFVGGAIDRGVFGGGTPREGPRVANLAVQSAAYGEPLPRIYGRMRVAGNLVWMAGIKETRTRSGGGKRGPATNTYSYSSSFAVIVAARAIVGVERIWADGKVLRASDGTHNFPATIRTYLGSEAQLVDALIAAAEGDHAPAFRGRAYLVFEDLPLADYGNRIPNLTFEVVADAGPVTIDAVARDLVDGVLPAQGSFPAVTGFVAAQAGSVRQILATVGEIGDLALRDDGMALRVGSGAAIPIAASEAGATNRDTPVAERHETRAADTAVPDAVWLTYSDPARDFQASVQAATRRSPANRLERRDLPVAVTSDAAKALAAAVLARAIAARTTGRVATSWRYAGVRPGDTVTIGSDAVPWRVTHRTITGAVVEFELDRMAAAGVAASAADSGRVFAGDDAPQGPTTLHVLDLPGLPGPLATTPRLLFAAGGAHGWRRADILVSSDNGASYTTAVSIAVPAIIGTSRTALAAGPTVSWDRRNAVDVELASGDADLQSVSEAAVLSGANLALIGDEIIQFAAAQATGSRLFRLTTLLRGRRGTERAVTDHVAGERFVVLDASVVPFDPPIEAVGAPLLFKAVGPADDPAAVAAQRIIPRGIALQPLSPAHLTLTVAVSGDRMLTWQRRSRAGFGWIDGTDAPLAEDSEAYRITVRDGNRVLRSSTVTTPGWRYSAADAASDLAGTAQPTIGVAQVSAAVGAGAEATIRV